MCIKQVPDTETRVKVAADGRTLDPTGVTWVLNPYDAYAIEAAPDGSGGDGGGGGGGGGGAAPAALPCAPVASIGGVPLRFALAPASRWTRAMKYLLTDLKWCAAWSAERRAGLGGGAGV